MENINMNGFCLLCTASASLVCHRCGDFYCSKECQLRDWQRHRYICFSVPPLVHPKACSVFQLAELESVSNESNPSISAEIVSNITQIPTAAIPALSTSTNTSADTLEGDKKESISIGRQQISAPNATNAVSSNGILHKTEATSSHNNSKGNGALQKADSSIILRPPNGLMPLTNSLVYITGFISPNRCFLRQANEKAEQDYSDICRKVNLLGNTLPRKLRAKQVEHVVLNHNGIFYRAKPAWTKNFIPRFILGDEGTIVTSKKCDMREMCTELAESPYCTVQVQLKDVPHYAFNDEIGQFLKQFEHQKFIVTYTGTGPVELRNSKTQLLLKTQIMEFCANMEIYGKHTLKEKSQSINSSTISLDKCHINAPANEKKAENNLKVSQNDEVKADKEAKIQDIQLDSILKKADETISKASHENVVTKSTVVEEPKINPKITDDEKSINNKELIHENDQNKSDSNTISVEKPKEKEKDLMNLMLNAEEIKALGERRETSIKNPPSEISSSRDVSPILIPPFEIRRLSCNKKDGLDVIVVDHANVSRGVIGAIDSINLGDFSKLCFDLSQLKDSECYRPTIKEYVIVKYQNSWRRAVVMEIKQNLYTVMFVDYRDVATVNEGDIRRYPTELTVPCHTTLCLIDGFPHRLTQRQISYLERIWIMKSPLHIDSVCYLQEMALIRCNNFIAELETYE